MYSIAQLTEIRRLIVACGLIRVFDGIDWIDLRPVLTGVLDQTISLATAASVADIESAAALGPHDDGGGSLK